MFFSSSSNNDPPPTQSPPNPSASSTDRIRPPQPLPSSLEKDVYTRTGYDPTSTWRSLFSIFSGRMTPHGEYLFVEDKFAANEQKDCLRCQSDRDYLIAYSPIIRFLNEKISDLGGGNIAGKIRCERCVTRVVDVDDATVEGGKRKEYWRKGGGFSPDHGILVCANEVRDRGHLEDVMAHEMVHAWDHLRWKVNWMDLRHSACTEIRASMLSGECRWTREFFKRNNYSITQQFQKCVRTRATKSVAARPFCKDDVQAAKVVNEVWESCFNDTRPFDEVYN